MTKIELDQKPSFYSMPVSLIGSIVNEKPNFMLCTWLCRVNRKPPVWMVSINIKHHTLKGIQKNQAFSINFPSADLLKKTDYCGISSGREIDKSTLFTIFYGKTKVPMIDECVLNIELKVNNLIEFPDHYIVLGNALGTYSDDHYLVDGKPDIKKMNPILYTGNHFDYWSVGEKLGDAFKVGKELRK
ncbi:MAG: flavin reductase family protein [Candidatus Hodarchaeales archaeon]|jgi:flavin reductase (DIM6/NTAB) family NADH-FMN oxidoreductase RutF